MYSLAAQSVCVADGLGVSGLEANHCETFKRQDPLNIPSVVPTDLASRMAPLAIPPIPTLSLPDITDTSILPVCDAIQQLKFLASHILDLQAHSQGSLELSEDAARQLEMDKKKLTNLKIMLRGFNREMYLQNRAVKQACSEAKMQMDNLYLELQNLKYEEQHLRSEIQDCRNYAYVPHAPLSSIKSLLVSWLSPLLVTWAVLGT